MHKSSPSVKTAPSSKSASSASTSRAGSSAASKSSTSYTFTSKPASQTTLPATVNQPKESKQQVHATPASNPTQSAQSSSAAKPTQSTQSAQSAPYFSGKSVSSFNFGSSASPRCSSYTISPYFSMSVFDFLDIQGPGFFGSLLQGFGFGMGSSLGHA